MKKQDMIVPRKELFEKWSKDIEEQRMIYIGAHVGWGKTASVCQWLKMAKKKYVYISAMDMEFLQKLTAYMPEKGTILVLDDLTRLDDIPEKEACIEQVLEFARYGNIVFIGRASLPYWLKPFWIIRQLGYYSYKNFIFNVDEVWEFFRQYDIQLDFDDCERIRERCRGWPAAMAAVAGHILSGNTLNKELFEMATLDIYEYFDVVLFKRWSLGIQNLLMAVAGYEVFSLELVKMVTGKRNIEETLNQLLAMGSFLTLKLPDTYTVFPFFHEYLCWKQKKECDESYISKKYHNGGLYYELQGDLLEAIKYYYMAGEQDKVAELLVENSRLHPGNGQFYEMEKYYLSLSKKTIESSIILMGGMSMLYSLLGEVEKSEYWLGRLEELKRIRKRGDKDYALLVERIAYLHITLPHRGSKKLIVYIKDAARLVLRENISFEEMSVTSNLPSLMNGGKDFSSWSHHDIQLYRLLGKPISIVLGRMAVGLADIGVGESLYEKNINDNFTEVLSWINRGISDASARGTLAIQFAGVGVIAKIFIARGNMEAARDMVTNIRKQAELEKNSQMLRNIDALLAQMFLVSGDNHEAVRWFSEIYGDIQGTFRTMDRLVYEAYVKILIMQGQYDNALIWIGRLEKYSKDYDRPMNYYKFLMLHAYILYQMNDEKWMQMMSQAVSWHASYHFIRPIADEGILVYDMLQQGNYDVDQKYFEALIQNTKRQVVWYPQYLKSKKVLVENFTETEKMVLRLIIQGMKNDEIAKILYVSVRTVKFHITHIYEKLGVSNRSMAIKLVNEKKLI